ncbi:MAG: hypothetical protein JW834_02705 [Candidatus Diapherotrites archaeon]|nr:hypothetical protein [Candidatus Diapherotrites archaeon]
MNIKKAEKELLTLQAEREKWMPTSRGIVIECAKAIREMHVHDEAAAKKRLERIRKDLHRLEAEAKKRPGLRSLLATPYQEYVELEMLIAFKKNKDLPELCVPADAYILGALDAIGEAKRVCMDLLKEDDYAAAEKLFKRMEDTYYSMEGLAFPKSLAPGLKAKQDAMKRSLESLHQTLVEARIRQRR